MLSSKSQWYRNVQHDVFVRSLKVLGSNGNFQTEIESSNILESFRPRMDRKFAKSMLILNSF